VVDRDGDQPFEVADVEDLGRAVEDDGEDPGLAGQPAAWPAVSRSPVEVSATPVSARRVS
jgi:hypothetical protein